MKFGLFTALFPDQPIEKVIELASATGIQMLEIGVGGYPGKPHCPIGELLKSQVKRNKWHKTITSAGLIVSALSCHNNPLDPNKEIASEADKTLRDAIQLAQLLEVPVVNTFSGCPGGAPGDNRINWITCAWPPDYAEGLKYQWEDVAIPYWYKLAQFAEKNGIKIGIEMHPGMLVYGINQLMRLRAATNDKIGANLDLSHLVWNGVDPQAAIEQLGPAIHHFHAKDVYVNPLKTSIQGCNDTTSYGNEVDRSWLFRTMGYGHDTGWWKAVFSALRLAGYDYVASIEHEDSLMSAMEGLLKAVAFLKQVCIFEKATAATWA